MLLFTVDFDGGDCGREFTVSQFDIFHLKADPNPVTSGGAASCIVKFRTDSSFSVYVQHLSVQDCTAKLFFYDNDNTQKYPVVGIAYNAHFTNTCIYYLMSDRPLYGTCNERL